MARELRRTVEVLAVVVIGCPKSVNAVWPHSTSPPLPTAIEQVRLRQPWFGYRRVVAQLQCDGCQVNDMTQDHQKQQNG